MNDSPRPRRQQINGRWYEQNAQGGWAPVADAGESSPGAITQQPQQPPVPQSDPTPAATVEPSEPTTKKPKKRRRLAAWVVGSVVACGVAAAGVAVWWYQSALQPVSNDQAKVRVTIEAGSSPSVIGAVLYEKNLIKNTLAFDIYTRLSGNRGNLQMGAYTLSPSLSTREIVEHLTSGKVDTYSLTLFSGEALLPPFGQAPHDSKDVQSVLKRAGFTDEQITAAFAATYKSPLLADRPAGSSLEGYLFPDTYALDSSMSAEQFIQQTLRTYEQVVEKNDLRAKFKARGLTLHEGITLASIIEKEMGRHTADMPQVAQVFYTRLAKKMPLGSDVTAYYGADRIGVARAVTVDTPYNTRIHTGMPPGPIGMPSEAALVAAANPAKGDYVYFLSGDDGKNYFARTNAEHERNIVDHCKVGCSIP